MEDRIILDLCGGTGAWSKPYKDARYDVRIVTLPDDVRMFKIVNQCPKSESGEQVYGILAAPPCTHFAGSGARWWKDKGLSPLLDGLSIVDACLRIIIMSRPKFWCLENPVGVNLIYPNHTWLNQVKVLKYIKCHQVKIGKCFAV